jgi:hypothetical protein
MLAVKSFVKAYKIIDKQANITDKKYSYCNVSHKRRGFHHWKHSKADKGKKEREENPT